MLFAVPSVYADWQTVGNAGFSADSAYYTSLALDSNNTPYVAYLDEGNGNKATVMKFDGSNWVTVGSAGFSASNAGYMSLVLDDSNMPYVAYNDLGNSNKATVMKFDGSNWVTVGSAGFSASNADFTSLALDDSNTPYVAYKDFGNGRKATVMKFDGSNWVTVGSAGFSTSNADFTSLALDDSNMPYVAYKDFGNGNKATVMKFDGSNWVTVGSAGFSAGQAGYTSLALDSSNMPYVAYLDNGNSGKATVMRFLAYLTLQKAGTGTGIVSSSGTPAGTSCGINCLAYTPTAVTLTATPDMGSTFSGWNCTPAFTSGGVLTADTMCTATFDKGNDTTGSNSSGLQPLPPTMNLKIDFRGNGTGSLKVENNKNFPGTGGTLGTCKNGDECYFPNLETASWVKITPTADGGSEFKGWGGSTYCQNGNPFMISNVSCIAYFSTIQAPHYSLTIIKPGTGEGTITSLNGSINCGSTCIGSFDSTVEIELSAVPAANSKFIGWSGDCEGETSHIHLKVTEAKTCSAQFELLPPPPPNQYLLTITKTGNGNGTVFTQDKQINCGDICNSHFTENSEIILFAESDNDAQFIEWQGDCVGHDNPIKITMAAAKSCVPVFDLKLPDPVLPPTIESEKLSVEKQGNGLGQVTTDPAGLKLHFDDTAGAEATADYVKGSTVKLLVEAKEGTTFIGFEGDPDCADSIVTMDVSKHCLAHFKQANPPPVPSLMTEPWPVIPPTVEQPPVVITPPPQSEQINDLPPVGNEICPTNRHYTIHLDEDCNAGGRTIKNLKIVRGGSLANAVVPGTINSKEGLVANTTIESTGILEGGSVTSFIINKGLMKNFELWGAEIYGGRLAGKIVIASFVINVIRDVTLEAGSVIQGKTGTVVQGVLTEEYVTGKLAGKITGDATNPALIEGVIITAGAQLDNVILGKDVILEKGVILGENVTFADDNLSPACEPNALSLDNKGNEVHDLQTCFILQPGKEHVEISVKVDPAHVGQKADLLFVIKASATEWYTLDKTTWKAWNGNLDSLKVKESFKKLPEAIVLEFSNSEFNELGSELTLFVGYQLPDGTIVYNSGESL